MSATTTEHEHEFAWYPAINEAGWKCCYCEHKPGEPPGYDPRLDRELFQVKVEQILMSLAMADVVHVSNSEHGDSIVGAVMERCADRDQYSIARTILDVMTDEHAAYWRKVGAGVLAGNDPRDRCPCGKLATTCRGGGDRRCGECPFPGDTR